MNALKKLSLHTVSKEKDESHGLREASHPNWGETKRIPRWKWNAVPQDDSYETAMERDQSILGYSRIPSKDFFRIIKSTDSEIHLDILREDLVLQKNKSNHILHVSALKIIYLLLSSAAMILKTLNVVIHLILIPNLWGAISSYYR